MGEHHSTTPSKLHLHKQRLVDVGTKLLGATTKQQSVKTISSVSYSDL
jgi:hypothetical protein